VKTASAGMDFTRVDTEVEAHEVVEIESIELHLDVF